MGEIVLETQRLELRRIGDGEAALRYKLLNTPKAMKYLGGPKTLAEIEAKQEKAAANYARDGFGFLHLYEKCNGELVGHAGLKRVDHPLAPNVGDFEIGWLVRDDRWRQGYALEAMQVVLEWAFETHYAPHLVALTSESNVASWKLMEKLGMTRRRDLDFDGPDYPPEDNPTIQYSLTKAQWKLSQ